MTVLIVDDQPSVVSGIFSGLDWEAIGVDWVLKAYSATEARLEFCRQPVDVMLCDIEMPGESGLALAAWVRERGYPAKCIFLTSHAEFLYAKQAVTLGGFDYIVQPARYRDIQASVGRAVEAAREDQEQAAYTSFGKAWYGSRSTVIRSVLRDFLLGRAIKKEELDQLLEQNSLPPGQARLAPVLVQLARVESAGWSEAAVEAALENILGELYQPLGQAVVVCALAPGQYAFLLCPGREAGWEQTLAAPLEQLVETGRRYLRWALACYVGEPAAAPDIPDTLRRARELAENNVTQAGGVFFVREFTAAARDHSGAAIPAVTKARWTELLAGGQAGQMELEAGMLLEQMARQGALDMEALQRFKQDFLQAAYQAAHELGIGASALYRAREDLKAAQESHTTVEKMAAFVACTARFFTEYSGGGGSAREQVERIVAYIYAHIDQNLRRTDIAESVFLNPDYLSRMFKKETGKSLKEYIIEQKMAVAKKLLVTTGLPVSIIALRVGYSNFSHFSQTYKRVTGLSPIEERQKNTGG